MPGALLQRVAAERVLSELQKNPEAWTRVDAILEKSQTQQAKFFALQVHLVNSCEFCTACCYPCPQVSVRVKNQAVNMWG